MKALLMHADQDFETQRELPANEEALSEDLELNTLLSAMAAGDPLLWEVARRGLLLSLTEPDAIAFRQQVLADCLSKPALARDLYATAGEALSAQRSVWGGILEQDAPRLLLRTSVRKMEILVGFLRRLREIADTYVADVRSPGLSRFFAMLTEELSADYFALIERYLKELNLKGGVLLSTRLTTGNKGSAYTLRRGRAHGFIARMRDRSGYSFTLADRDDAGASAIAELEDKGLNVVADSLAQSVDHVLGFLRMLRTEVGFYVACLNLADELTAQGDATTLPDVLPISEVTLRARGLYDVSLALTMKQRVVANDVEADGKSLVMITGANQGGKSTFLRSVGLAQLMAQCGMFVTAESYRVNACDGVFTHYKREEDETMESGKLDEELGRMSEIADRIHRGCLLLCNESFAATNEREGSQIARQVIDAMLAENIKVLFVTHLFDLADGYHELRLPSTLFLRAGRSQDGGRSFRLAEGAPLPPATGKTRIARSSAPLYARGERIRRKAEQTGSRRCRRGRGCVDADRVARASTFTLGSTTQPIGSTANARIQTGFYAQSAGPTGIFTLPAGGRITQWRTNTDGETPGTAISLVALTRAQRHAIGMMLVRLASAIIFTSHSHVMPIQDPPPTLHDPQRAHHLLMLEFGDRTEFDDPKLEYRRLFSELLGTFMLVLVAAGGGLLHAKGQISLAAAVVAPGLMVLAIILFMGAVSGAHLNPAVSLAFAVRGDFPWKRVPGYIIMQLLGATLACLFLLAVFGNVEHLGATLPGPGYHDWQAFLMEIALTGVLLSVILGTASAAQNVGAIGALGVGGYIALAGLWSAPVSGTSMNPARSFGPALVSGDWTAYWVYVAGPLIGAAIAVGCAIILRGRGGDPISHAAGSGVLTPGRLAEKTRLSRGIDEGTIAPPGFEPTDKSGAT